MRRPIRRVRALRPSARPLAGLFVLVVAVVLALSTAGCGRGSGVTNPSPVPTPTPTPTHPLPALSAMLSDKVMGSPSAPVTMIAYSSLTCSHCGDFHVTTLPVIKANYIDTGRLQFIQRDFPLNEAAWGGAMAARCAGDRYLDAVGLLFGSQYSWAFSSNWKAMLKPVLSPLGLTSDDIDACLAREDLRAGLNDIKQGATTVHGVTATPTFLINGRKVVGALPYAEFDAIIKAALAQ